MNRIGDAPARNAAKPRTAREAPTALCQLINTEDVSTTMWGMKNRVSHDKGGVSLKKFSPGP